MSTTLRHPTADDGTAVAELVRATGVLDVNSVYAYCLILEHFGQTCVVAELDGDVVGFVTAHRLPSEPDVLFVWQVGVDSRARGEGLAGRMLQFVLEATPAARWLHTTVSPDNVPSTNLFQSLARRLGTELTVGPGFTSEQLGGDHPDEPLFRIGPISRRPQ